jgi:hypothetical protein
MATSNKRRFPSKVMLDIEDRVDTDALMITRRLCISPHDLDGIVLRNLINANGKF